MKKLLWFLLPLFLGCVGVAVWILGFYSFLTELKDTGISLNAPGKTMITITNAGDYTVWIQTRGMVDGAVKNFPDRAPTGLTVKAVKMPGGTKIPLRTSMSSSIESGRARRISVAALTFTGPGQYQIDVSGLKEERTMSLDQKDVFHGLFIFLAAGLTGLFFVVAGIISGIYALVRATKKR